MRFVSLLPWVAVAAAALAAAAARAEEITYRQHIRPLWEEKCMGCHGSHTPTIEEFNLDQKKYTAVGQGPRMDSYGALVSFVGWPDTGALMRRLDDGRNTADGKPGNMYELLGADEAQRQKYLALFKAWVGEGAWNLNRWQRKGKVPAITKEQMDRIRVSY